MVILVGGVSQTGKTLMSQILLEKFKIPYLSIDHLKMGLYRSKKDCGFTPLDSIDLIARKLWPIVKEMIKTVIENKQNIIIEGCYLLPHLVKDLENDYSEEIISFYLGFSTNYIQENFESSILKYRSVIESRDAPEERPISQFINEHSHLREQCIKNNAKYFKINKDYNKEIKRVYEYVDNQINNKK